MNPFIGVLFGQNLVFICFDSMIGLLSDNGTFKKSAGKYMLYGLTNIKFYETSRTWRFWWLRKMDM